MTDEADGSMRVEVPLDEPGMNSWQERGFAVTGTDLPDSAWEVLKAEVFCDEVAGKRALLDVPVVRQSVDLLRDELVKRGWLASGAVAIQAIAFDKTPAANWKVSWHQDLMFPVTREELPPGFTLRCEKDGIPYARPPVEVLQELAAVRLHLDDCPADNGPLRVAPGTHRLGILAVEAVADAVARHGECAVPSRAGEALLMRPLLLHASSTARSPGHRRVLHVVFHEASAAGVVWHRVV